MQTRRFVKYAAGALSLGVLASAVAIGAVAPVDRSATSAVTRADTTTPAMRSAQNATGTGGGNSTARSRSFTPSEEISADLPVSFPADI